MVAQVERNTGIKNVHVDYTVFIDSYDEINKLF